MNDDDENDLTPEVPESKSSAVDKVQKTKKAVDNAKKVADLAKKSSKFAKLGPIIGTVGIVILVIIIIVGVLMFFVFMPGMVAEKLKQVAQSIVDWFQSKWEGAAEAYTNEEQILEVANYLDQMGYDLKGYGFVTEDVKKELNNGYIDNGIGRSSDDNSIIKVNSEVIRTYLVSDAYSYIAANFDWNLKDWWGGIWNGGYSGSGLLSIRHDNR